VPRWLRRLLKGLLTLAVLAAVGAAVDPSALLASLHGARWTWVAGAAALVPLNLALDGWVWRRLLRPVLGRVSLRRVAGAVLSGLALGFWAPARVGEYAGRALVLPEGDGWTLSLTVFAQRMADMAVGVLVGLAVLVGALYAGTVPATLPWLGAAAIGGGTAAVLLTFLTAPSLAHRLARRMAPVVGGGIAARTACFRDASGRGIAAVLAGTGARYLVFTGQLACLGAAFAPSAPIGLLWVAAALTFYVKYLVPSLTALDLGVREGGAAFFFQLLGLGAAAGVNAALVLFALNVLAPAALGAPLVATLRLSPTKETADRPRPTLLPGS
jgi:uncharacterized membrane protein YbhN (UPF0104 family)